MEKYFSKIMKNFPIIDINQQKKEKKSPLRLPQRGGEMDGKGMRNENGKDEKKGKDKKRKKRIREKKKRRMIQEAI